MYENRTEHLYHGTIICMLGCGVDDVSGWLVLLAGLLACGGGAGIGYSRPVRSAQFCCSYDR